MSTAIRCGALALALGLGACGSDAMAPNGQFTLQLNADVAQFAADAAGEDVDIMREPVFFMQMPGFGGGASLSPGIGDLRPANCPFNAETGRLECTTLVLPGGVTIDRSYAFWDADDVVQEQYDEVTTATANIRTDIEGERTGIDWTASIERHRDLTATGLAGTETQRTWNGTGSSEVTRSRHTEDGDRSYSLSCTLEVDDVVVPVPGSDAMWPLSGTITRTCTITFVGGLRDGQTVERTAVITFNGTQFATLTVGGRTFQVDLATRHRTGH